MLCLLRTAVLCAWVARKTRMRRNKTVKETVLSVKNAFEYQKLASEVTLKYVYFLLATAGAAIALRC